MREIVFDTETTGLDPVHGDRIVEIGAIELLNHFPTGRSFHRYLNPERRVPADAARIHGLDDAFLKDKPLFAQIADEFLEFVGAAILIARVCYLPKKAANSPAVSPCENSATAFVK
jgi:DNA polymerase-3 subunit epsilon